jgi:hypothetical protein
MTRSEQQVMKPWCPLIPKESARLLAHGYYGDVECFCRAHSHDCDDYNAHQSSFVRVLLVNGAFTLVHPESTSVTSSMWRPFRQGRLEHLMAP